MHGMYSKMTYYMSGIVTFRLDRETKNKARLYKVNISGIAREALRREIARRERDELLEELKGMKTILKKNPTAGNSQGCQGEQR